MNEQLIIEFQEEYSATYAPVLPERLQGYRFLSCLCAEAEREIFLLEKPDGKRILCKHASGVNIVMLRTERDMDIRHCTSGSFSFFPYIIDYHETEQDGWLLREYIEGDTLEELVEKNGALPRNKAREIMLQLCQCFQKLHHATPPIIYRDLKPSNVVLTKAGECYLIDMGTARIYRNGNDQDTILVGTAATAAPEQYGARQTDERTDIYALGLLYAYLLTGEQKKAGEPEPLPHTSEAKIIKKAASFDPANRYQNIEEFIAALEALTPLYRRKRYAAAIGVLSLALVCSTALLIKTVLSRKGSLPSEALAHGNVSQGNDGSGNDAQTSGDGAQMPGTTVGDGSGNDTKLPVEPVKIIHAPDEEVVFESSSLRKAVYMALGKSEGESVLYGELGEINGLFLCGDCTFDDYYTHMVVTPFNHCVLDDYHDNAPAHHDVSNPDYGDVRDLSLLAYMVNLKKLVMDYQRITDISPLAGLPLTHVSLCGNPFTDISALSECTYLNELFLHDTPVTSLEPLAGLQHLNYLNICRTKVTELAPIRDCPIHYLSLGGTTLVTDGESLAEAPIERLEGVNLSHETFEALSKIKALNALEFTNCSLTSLNELSMFGQVSEFYIGFNQISNLDGIEHFPKLTVLYVNNGPLTDITGLKDAKTIQKLVIHNTYIIDFSPLAAASTLKLLKISPSDKERLADAVPEPWFEVKYGD